MHTDILDKDKQEKQICPPNKKERAIKLYGEIGKVINRLEYPSPQNMYTWIWNINIVTSRLLDHRNHPSLKAKLNILHHFFENGEDIFSVSKDTGYSRSRICLWRRKYLGGGSIKLMNKKKHLP